jgi:hypothetical protein
MSLTSHFTAWCTNLMNHLLKIGFISFNWLLKSSFQSLRRSTTNVNNFHCASNLSYYFYTIIIFWLYGPFLGLGSFFSFLILYTVGRTPWTGDQPVARPLLTHRTTQTQNKSTHTFMPWVEFEPTIPVFERAKTVHALERAATVIRNLSHY